MTRIKICGLTRPADVRLACELGASYVGFVFAADSPRRVDISVARQLSEAVPAGVQRVGVFVDESYPEIARAVAEAGLDLVQVHRLLRDEDLEKISVPILTVARVVGGAAAVPPPDLLSRCQAILFDTAGRDRQGGTGRRFDWGVVAGRKLPLPLFLGGGLDSSSVEAAIRQVRPFAVDVSSGVESEPGMKDTARMTDFFQAVRQTDAHAG
ncbi:MAG TPA: phosphoribosylanthranilate isomerase [Thermoanaerobaculia bacterium]